MTTHRHTTEQKTAMREFRESITETWPGVGAELHRPHRFDEFIKSAFLAGVQAAFFMDEYDLRDLNKPELDEFDFDDVKWAFTIWREETAPIAESDGLIADGCH